MTMLVQRHAHPALVTQFGLSGLRMSLTAPAGTAVQTQLYPYSCLQPLNVNSVQAPGRSQASSTPQSLQLAGSDVASKWYQLLQHLKGIPQAAPGSSEYLNAVVAVIRLAIAAAKVDPAWRDSGISEHLERAEELCQQDVEAGLRDAMALLDFHRVVLRSTSPRRNLPIDQRAVDRAIAEVSQEGNSQSSSAPSSAPQSGGPRVIIKSGHRLCINKGNTQSALPAASTPAATVTLPASQQDVRRVLDATFPSTSLSNKRGRAASAEPASTSGSSQASDETGVQSVTAGERWQRSPALDSVEQCMPLKKRRLTRNGSDQALSGEGESALEAAGSSFGSSSESAQLAQEMTGPQDRPPPVPRPVSPPNQHASVAATQMAQRMLNHGKSDHSGSISFHSINGTNVPLRRTKSNSTTADGASEGRKGCPRNAQWSGKVKHKLGDSTVELFYLTALIPDFFVERFPPSIFVSALVHRATVRLTAKHQPMRCRLDFLTDKQLEKLTMLAKNQLAAVCTLQHCNVTLVPYLNEKRALRIVGFMVADD